MEQYPSVTIAMAVYKPDREFFIKQLQSVNAQDYPNITLLIWNDSPADIHLDTIVSQYITNFPYRIMDNGKNNGVTQAFAQLTQYSTGKYIAYSDQDDIWLSNKISVMVQFMERHIGCSCCHSDAQLIDENNNVERKTIFPDLLNVINNINYQRKTFFDKNWNLGCAMMIRTNVAKKALPFPKMVFHDQWLEIYALTKGKFHYLSECLIQHRVHSSNNSQTLHGVSSKADYYEKKLNKDALFLKYIINRLSWFEEYYQEEKWIQARKKYSRNPNISTFFYLLIKIKIRPMVTMFELFLPFIPDFLFTKVLNLIRKEIKRFNIR